MMNDYAIAGVNMCDFLDKQGKQVRGATVYLLTKDNNVVGLKGLKIWLNSNMLDNLTFNLEKSINEKVHVYFNEHGKAVSIELA